jgi:hypothetical protein
MPRPAERPPRRRRVAGQRGLDRSRPPSQSVDVTAATPTQRPDPTRAPSGQPARVTRERRPPVPAGWLARLPSLRIGAGARSAPWLPVIGVLTAAVVLLAVVTFFMQDSYHGAKEDRADVNAGNSAAAAASAAMVDVLSYDYRRFDADVARAEARLTGAFRQQYHSTQMDTVKRTAVRYKATVKADVVAAGAIDADAGADQATVLVFVDQTASNSKLSAPRIDKSRVRLQMRRVDGRWLIAQLDPI